MPIREFPETHQHGRLTVENLEHLNSLNLRDIIFGLQVSKDGRVWVCVNGVALLRFTPQRDKSLKPSSPHLLV